MKKDKTIPHNHGIHLLKKYVMEPEKVKQQLLQCEYFHSKLLEIACYLSSDSKLRTKKHKPPSYSLVFLNGLASHPCYCLLMILQLTKKQIRALH